MAVKKRVALIKSKRESSAKKKENKKIDKLDLILNKLDNIEQNQNVLLKTELTLKKEEDAMISLEKKEISEEKTIEKKEEVELDELKKIEALEQNIKQGMKDSPLKRITYKDISKGIIGAFFGIIGHFAFVEGTHLSEEFSFMRSTFLLVTSFVIILVFLYFSGFRKVNDRFVFKFLPIRALVIYISSIISVVVVLLLYGMINAETGFMHIYSSVAAISILAVLGAATADLIGKNE